MSSLENLAKSVVANLLLEAKVKIQCRWILGELLVKDFQHFDDSVCNCADKALEDGHFVCVAT